MVPQENCVSYYVDNILACYNELAKLPILEPSPQVNNAFENLVEICAGVPGDTIVERVGVP